MRIPARGEIWLVNLNSTMGQEQQGTHPIFVVSEQEFNRLGLCVSCPITQGGQQSRNAGFTVSLLGMDTKTQGVVLCNQLRTLDIKARNGHFIENSPDYLIDEVMARLQPIFEHGI
jgi:mRNA-degrading endonuclease toxin of MazEF toxin-antitoxin module